MAKFTKNNLKALIKECLVEILAEGIGEDANLLESKTSSTKKPARNNVSKSGRSNSRPKRKKRTSIYENLEYSSAASNPQQSSSNNEKFTSRVTESVSTLTNDPIMSSIFADTASTSLQEQIAAESHGHRSMPARHADRATQMANESDPTDLFGDAASNWAKIAFSNERTKNS